MRRKRKLTPRGAIWTGLLATPLLVVAAVVAIGVAVAPAGPEKTTAASAEPQLATHATQQTVAQAEAYWTPERMAAAQPYPMTRSGAPSPASDSAASPGPAGSSPGALPGGVLLPDAGPVVGSPAAGAPEPQEQPYDSAIPYTRWSLIGRYDKYPNYTILKMFFSQDHDGNGTLSNFVCSASTFGPDEAWTAGHCVTNNLSGVGANAGWSTNVLVCPVYDNGFQWGHGCWGSDLLISLTAYRNGGNGNVDFGAIDTSNNGTVIPGALGSHTGWLGFAWNQGRDQHWVAMGYPAGSPFAGGKIIMAASAYGYDEDWSPDSILSVAMGSNLTGGSSGGPWILQYGLPGQVGGAGNNYINGHNDWKWSNRPDRMMSPYYDCRQMVIFNFLRGTTYCT